MQHTWCFAVPFTLSETQVLLMSSSEELDIESIEAEDDEDLPPHSAYEELVEVETLAVTKLNIDWSAEK